VESNKRRLSQKLADGHTSPSLAATRSHCHKKECFPVSARTHNQKVMVSDMPSSQSAWNNLSAKALIFNDPLFYCDLVLEVPFTIPTN
jgi:hypothetical protein